LVLSRVRLIRVRLVLVNLNPINDTYIYSSRERLSRECWVFNTCRSASFSGEMFAEIRAFQELSNFDSQFMDGVKGVVPCTFESRVFIEN